MPFTTHTDAGGRHWQHQNTGTFIPGLRKTDDCGFTSRALSSRIGSPFADKGVYESQTNSNVLEHMKRVNTSGLNISDKHSSIDFLRDLPDQVWKEEPSKIDHSGVQHDPHGIKLEDREFRIFVEKRLATNSIGRYEMLQILIGNGLSSFGTDDQLKDRLTAASARVCVNTTPPPLPQPFILAALHPYSHSLTLVFAGSIQGRSARRDQ